MKQTAVLEFKSAAFAVALGEDENTNPGIFGKALAQWLADELGAKRLRVGEVIPEDFGWCVPIESTPHSLFVVCANDQERPDHWRVFACAEGGILARVFGKDQRNQSLASLFSIIRTVLQESPLVSELGEMAN